MCLSFRICIILLYKSYCDMLIERRRYSCAWGIGHIWMICCIETSVNIEHLHSPCDIWWLLFKSVMTGFSLWSHYRHKHGAILFMCKTVRHAKCILLAKPEVQDNGMCKHWIHNLSLWFEVVHPSVWSSCLAVYCNLSRDIILGDLWSRVPDQEIKSTEVKLKMYLRM